MPATLSYNNIQKIFWGLSLLTAVCICAAVYFREAALFYFPFGVLAALFVLFYDVKILFFLLLFFIPFSIEYSVTRTLSTDLPDEPMMAALAGCIILYLLYKPSLAAKFASHPLIQILFLELAWIVITVFFSYEKTVSAKYVLAKSWYILAFVFGTGLLVKTKRDFMLAGLCYCIPMLIIMAWALYNHALNGFSFESANHVMQPFFRNHVNYSSLLVCIIPILFLFHHFAGPAQKKIWKWVIVTALVGLLFSYSRGAWLALIAGGGFIYLIKRKWVKQALVTATACLLFVVGLLIYNDNYVKFAPDFNKTIFHSNFGDHMVATYQLTDVSNAERFYRWIAGVRMSGEELLTGYGPNNFYAHYKKFADARFKTWVSTNEDHSSVHNYFLLLLIEQGIPGMLIFYFLLFTMFMYVQHLYHRVRDEFYKYAVLAIGVILTMITVVNLLSDLIETDKIGSLFYVCLGLLPVIDFKTREENTNPVSR